MLSDNIALRSWRLVPYAYYIKYVRNANGLKEDEYNLLKRCDGLQDLEESELLNSLIKRGLCRLAKNGDKLTSWQKEKICDNRYFPAMNLMLTGKCNYNCLHCFNASDNSRLQSELSLEDTKKLITEAEICGINAFTITGGEPMMHPEFLDIIHMIYEHGMYIEELNTNGYFLNQKILDEFKKILCYPVIKISFDGLGFHDWMRDKIGAETETLKAIKLCKENGFYVKVQTNANRKNIESILPTAKYLNDLGVHEMRIIRTTESPRWKENAGDASFTAEEYFDEMLKFLKEYIKLNCKMAIDIWEFLYYFPPTKEYTLRTFECQDGEYRDNMAVCRGSRGMIAVGANGNLYPCHQLSGYYEKHNIYLGNAIKDGLQKNLQSGAYIDNVCTTLKDLKEHNNKCANCKWFKNCCGGCRAIAMALQDDIYGSDSMRCTFFNNGYIEKVKDVFK